MDTTINNINIYPFYFVIKQRREPSKNKLCLLINLNKIDQG
ncbi:hypothetical protein SAMN04487909_12552 [Aneurinibacillus migulanus]|uniref:Uncharacterized protein n=1 Tax=Aneurinibacillus migulanus TaxID=47500 RepID=A0A1G8VTK0_ANEMI|nr:hypothetical protein SAMN04487909_12552 [Aneurinibacillus migulanus]